MSGASARTVKGSGRVFIVLLLYRHSA